MKISVNFDEEQLNLELDINTNSGRQSINLTLYDNSQTIRRLLAFSGNGEHKMQITIKSGNIN